MDLALNNLPKLICHKTQQTKPSFINTIHLILFAVQIVSTLALLLKNIYLIIYTSNYFHFIR